MTVHQQTFGLTRRQSRRAHARPYAVYARQERTRTAVRAAAEVAAGVLTLGLLWGSLIVAFAMAAASR